MRPVIALSILCATLALVPAGARAASPYDDVPADHWSYPALDYVCKLGALEGYPAGFFSGQPLHTRYAFAQAVARLQDTVSYQSFPAHVVALSNDLYAEYFDMLEGGVCKLPAPGYEPPSTGREAVVPKDYWAFGAIEQLENKGLLRSDALAMLSGPYGVTRVDFAQAIAVALSNGFLIDDPEVNDLLDRLYFEFRDCLRLCAVAPTDRQPEPIATETQSQTRSLNLDEWYRQHAYDVVPADHWAYNALYYLISQGRLPGYSVEMFSGQYELTHGEFVLAIERMREYAIQHPASERVDAMIESLQAEFSAGKIDSPGFIPEPFAAIWGLSSSPASNSAYDDVPLDHWAYPALDESCRRGILTGYPDAFWGNGSARSRYEFAQAIVRLTFALAETSDKQDPMLLLVVDALVAEFADQLRVIYKAGELGDYRR